jgi:hypothetical protein
MVRRAIAMDGTVTGEHGVGLVKRDYLVHELGQTTVDMMRKVRRIIHFPLSLSLSLSPSSLFSVSPSLAPFLLSLSVSPKKEKKKGKKKEPFY